MDQIQQKLIEQATKKRLQASEWFKSMFDKNYASGANSYKVTSIDDQGFVHLQDTETGKLSTINPAEIVYKQSAIDPTTGLLQSQGTGGGIQNFMSLGSSVISPLIQVAQGKSNKNGGAGARSGPDRTWKEWSETQGPGSSGTGPGSTISSLKAEIERLQNSININTIEKATQNLSNNAKTAKNALQDFIDTHNLEGISTNKALYPEFQSLQTAYEQTQNLLTKHLETIYQANLTNAGLTAQQQLDTANAQLAKVEASLQIHADYENGMSRILEFKPTSQQSAVAAAQLQKSGVPLYKNAKGEYTPETAKLIRDQANSNTRQAIEANLDRITAKKDLIAQYNKEHPGDDVYNDGFEEISAAERDHYIPTDAEIELQARKSLIPKFDANHEAYNKGLSMDQFNDMQRQAWRSAEIKLGVTAAATVGTGYGFVKVLKDMWKDGITTGGVLGSAGLFTGMAVSMNVMHHALMDATEGFTKLSEHLETLPFLKHIPHLGGALEWLTSMQGTAAVGGGLFLLAYLLGRKKDPEDEALKQLNEDLEPVVWSNNGAITAAGLAFAVMGLQQSPNLPNSMQLNVPQIQINEALQKTAGGIPDPLKRYSTVFLDQDKNGKTIVYYLTDGGVDSQGNKLETLHMEKMPDTVRVTDPGSNAYIPFFVKDGTGKTIRNPKVVKAISKQQRLLDCSQITNATDAQKCAELAGTASHTP